MNYRTTYDTKNLPSSTKKNVKELNAAAKLKEESQVKGDASGKKETAKAAVNEDAESGSESEDESAGGKQDKEKKKKEWYVVYECVFLLLMRSLDYLLQRSKSKHTFHA